MAQFALHVFRVLIFQLAQLHFSAGHVIQHWAVDIADISALVMRAGLQSAAIPPALQGLRADP